MSYGASLLVEAERPTDITVGRFTWRARPISAPHMLRLQAARSQGAAHQLLALALALRAAFPFRQRYRLAFYYRDPVRVVFELPDVLRSKVIASLLDVPGSGRDGTADEDPIEQMRREQRELVYGKQGAASGNVPTLATALTVVRAAFGDTWYFNPTRWATTDGYAPFKVVWAEYMGLQAMDARLQLSRADSIAFALATNQSQKAAARGALLRAAYPADPLTVS